ncbi:MAG: ACP S-malonyltransferase [Myxococcales bacterium]|nr:ACP S-malonyltransferase [Myxococcales bacterium]
MKTALLFAGQATQYVGMGRALFERFPEARAVFEAADDALGEPLSKTIFGGPEEALNRTENTQPAVLTVALATFEVLDARGFRPTVLAGHSLGEYGALVAAGALEFRHAVRLVRRRGLYMQAAVPEGVGAMAAVQRVDDEVVAAACAEIEGLVDPAVFNAPGVTVISGEAEAVAQASALLKERGAIIVPLAVSAPFHCRLLEPAAVQLAADLADTPFRKLHTPYVSNVDAEWVETADADAIRDKLVRQVTGTVRWRESIALMLERGVERFWHVGPGRTNITHVKRQTRKVATASLDKPEDLQTILNELESL